jgi:transcriptional regulator NrdR family protein
MRRTNYAAPDCPRCGAAGGQQRVTQTYYTPDNETVRVRRCCACQFRWTTLQAAEVILLPDRYQVVSSRSTTRVNKQVTIKKL